MPCEPTVGTHGIGFMQGFFREGSDVVLRSKPLLETLAPSFRAPTWVSAGLLPTQLPVSCAPWLAQMEPPAPGFRLTQPAIVVFWVDDSTHGRPLSLSLPKK